MAADRVPATMVDISPGHCPYCGAGVDVVVILDLVAIPCQPERVDCDGAAGTPHGMHDLHLCVDPLARWRLLRAVLGMMPAAPNVHEPAHKRRRWVQGPCQPEQ
jgi:hypothetical protein